jgi:hypothetical protein
MVHSTRELQKEIFDPIGLFMESVSRRSHRLTQPHVARIAIESRMPSHQEMKWMQLAWRFHNAQLAIFLNH